MTNLLYSLLLLASPRSAWAKIATQETSSLSVLVHHTLPLALIPAVCWYFGVTQQGWQVGDQIMRLTPQSALPMCVMFYFACVGGVAFMAYMVRWMSTTYATEVTLAQATTLISYTATPFFAAGVIGLFPLLWLDIAVGIAVACFCIYLLFTGVSPVMQLDPQHSFLYSSAVLALTLILFVGLLTVTVLVWDFGPHPEYTY